MGTFSVSLTDDEQKLLDDEAEANERSRAAQVRVILKDWFEKRRGPLEHRRQSWRSPYTIQKEERIARERMKIPVCQNCGVRCTVCAPKFGQPARCCLILAGKPE